MRLKHYFFLLLNILALSPYLVLTGCFYNIGRSGSEEGSGNISAQINADEAGAEVIRGVNRVVQIPFVNSPMDFSVVDNYAQQTPDRVAVLPFKYAKDTIDNDKIIYSSSNGARPSVNRLGINSLRNTFFKYFSTLSYDDIDVSVVDAVLVDNGVKTIRELYDMPPQQICKILNADAVIMGEIDEASNFTGGLYSQTVLSGKLNMYGAKTGNALWSVKHYEADKGGVIYKSGQVMDIIDNHIQNAKKDIAFKRIAEEFARKTVDTIPEKSQISVNQNDAPVITSVAVEGGSINAKVFFPSDKLTVQIDGSAGMQAYFDIGGWKTNIPMKELSPGRYYGSYWVQFGDEVSGQAIVGKLKNRFGLETIRILENNLFTCRGKNLPEPTNLKADYDNSSESIKISWDNRAKNAAGFTVYRCDSQNGKFVPVGNTNTDLYIDKIAGLKTGIFSYQVIAYDIFGNPGNPSQTVEVVIDKDNSDGF